MHHFAKTSFLLVHGGICNVSFADVLRSNLVGFDPSTTRLSTQKRVCAQCWPNPFTLQKEKT